MCKEIREERGQLTSADLLVTSIPKAGHYPFLDQPDLFMKALLEQTRPYRWDLHVACMHMTCWQERFLFGKVGRSTRVILFLVKHLALAVNILGQKPKSHQSILQVQVLPASPGAFCSQHQVLSCKPHGRSIQNKSSLQVFFVSQTLCL